MEAYLPIGILFGIALIVCVAVFGLSALLGPRVAVAIKNAPYECGVKGEGDARTPFKPQFYLIAVLFLLFDVEAAFFFPWALVYRTSLASGPGLFFGILVYLGLMVLGLIYVIRREGLLKLN